MPQLSRTREQLLNALIKVSSGNPARASDWLGLGPGQAADLERNARLDREPTAPARQIYTGVLFGELDLESLPDSTQQLANDQLLIASGLFGLISPGDRIPAYRLSGSASLPRLGTIASRWKPVLPKTIAEFAGNRLVVDLRSGSYIALGKVPSDVARTSIRVLSERDGKRSVVSHFNKATKGKIVRQLLLESVTASTVDELAHHIEKLGWHVEKRADQLDVVLFEN